MTNDDLVEEIRKLREENAVLRGRVAEFEKEIMRRQNELMSGVVRVRYPSVLSEKEIQFLGD